MTTKTRSNEGILFYGRQQYPSYSHVAVSLYNASLQVSIVFTHPVSFNELYVSMGHGLDDNRCVRAVLGCHANAACIPLYYYRWCSLEDHPPVR